MGTPITDQVVRRLVDTVDAGLTKGLGHAEPGNMCVEAAVCYALGLPHSDQPDCVHRVIRAYKIRVNDANWSSDAARAQGMRRAAVAQLGSLNIDQKAWIAYVVPEITKRIVPMAIAAVVPLFPDHRAELEKAAAECRGTGGGAAALAARDLLWKVRSAAAAYAAAYAAYADAAVAAAADAAAYAAAYAAYADAAAADAAVADAAYAAVAAAYAAARKPSLLALVPKPDAILNEAAEICVEACILTGTDGAKYLDEFAPKVSG